MASVKYWTAGAVVLVVVILAAGWLMIASPRYSHASDLRDQAQTAEQANRTLQSQVDRLKQEQKKQPEQLAQLKHLTTQIPDTPDLAGLTTSLQATATAAQVQLVSIQPDVVVALAAPTPAASKPAGTAPVAPGGKTADSGPALNGLHVSVEVKGTYSQTEAFFKGLEKLSRILVVYNINMSSGVTAGPAAKGPAQMDTKVDLTAFAAPVSAAPKPTTAAAAAS